MSTYKGFSLIELLIVVAIILIVAAIAIPNLLRSRIGANEASATAALRTISLAEVTYSATYHSGFTDNLNRLGAPPSGQQADRFTADLLDPVLSGQSLGGGANTFSKAGYRFVYTPTGNNTSFGFISQYRINADPQVRGSTGQRSFYSDHSAIIRANATTAATTSDPLI